MESNYEAKRFLAGMTGYPFGHALYCHFSQKKEDKRMRTKVSSYNCYKINYFGKSIQNLPK